MDFPRKRCQLNLKIQAFFQDFYLFFKSRNRNKR
jgi:hypothetical protein